MSKSWQFYRLLSLAQSGLGGDEWPHSILMHLCVCFWSEQFDIHWHTQVACKCWHAGVMPRINESQVPSNCSCEWSKTAFVWWCTCSCVPTFPTMFHPLCKVPKLSNHDPNKQSLWCILIICQGCQGWGTTQRQESTGSISSDQLKTGLSQCQQIPLTQNCVAKDFFFVSSWPLTSKAPKSCWKRSLKVLRPRGVDITKKAQKAVVALAPSSMSSLWSMWGFVRHVKSQASKRVQAYQSERWFSEAFHVHFSRHSMCSFFCHSRPLKNWKVLVLALRIRHLESGGTDVKPGDRVEHKVNWVAVAWLIYVADL